MYGLSTTGIFDCHGCDLTKRKKLFEKLLPTMDIRIQDIYMHTKEGNYQKWLMIDVEDKNQVYEDLKTILHIRADRKIK